MSHTPKIPGIQAGTTLQSNVGGLQDDVSTIKSDITTLQSDVQTLQNSPSLTTENGEILTTELSEEIQF